MEALRSLGMVGTPPEERFDRVVRLAQQIFRVPIVAVSFIDGDRHWVKAHVGLDGPDLTRVEAFCRYTILDPGTMVVRDAAVDERFAANPVVTGSPHVRFYVGHPVRSPGGHRVGALYIIDSTPRDLGDEHAAMLSELAGWIESELRLREELARAEGVQHGSASPRSRRRFRASTSPDAASLRRRSVVTSSTGSRSATSSSSRSPT